MAGIWHPRTGFTAFLLLLSATTELVIINLIPQHDPESDPEFASCSNTRFSQAFLHIKFELIRGNIETGLVRCPGDDFLEHSPQEFLV